MSKGESIMKPNKEQKGKNAVLVIAVGKHPKMGPGERKPKGLKKADEPKKKSKSQARREKRAARAEKRQAKDRSEGGSGLEDRKNLGTKQAVAHQLQQAYQKNPDQFKKVIERRRISMEELGAKLGADNMEDIINHPDSMALNDAINSLAEEKAQGRHAAREERAPKTLDDAANKFKFGLAEHRQSELSDPSGFNAYKLGNQLQQMGVKDIPSRGELQAMSLDEMRERGLPIDEAFKSLGQAGFEARAFNRRRKADRSRGGGITAEKQRALLHQKYGSDFSNMSERDQRLLDASWDPHDPMAAMAGVDDDPDEVEDGKEIQRLKRIAMARSHGDKSLDRQEQEDAMAQHQEEGRHERGGREGWMKEVHNAPSQSFTTPFATAQGTGVKESSKRGGTRGSGSTIKPNTTVEETMHGFAPLPSPGLARVGDEPTMDEEETDFDAVDRTMEDYQRGNPMDLAFRLLKKQKKCAKCGCIEKGSMCKAAGCA